MQPVKRSRIVDGLRYSTETATLIAGDDWWDGHNWERRGTNTFLFRTPRGRYFVQRRSQWEGADDGRIEPVSVDEAINLYTYELREHRVPYEDAFPGIEVEDA
jgi:hypothetical protein